jgi:uncharacterized membrane protein YdjX (TVP38/TMEM64 family)
VFVFALISVWLAVVFGPEIGNWWERTSATFTSPEDFRAWVESFGAWGPVVFLLAQALQVILAPIPGTLFPPVGALAFGPWVAMGLSLAGLAIGSAVVFLAARRWGRPLAVRLLGEDPIQRYQNVMTARGGLLLWVVFLFPLLPDDAVCALAGLSGISFRRFLLIATVGRVPAVAAGVFAMAGLEGAPAWVWLVVASAFAIVMWLGTRYGRRLETWLLSTLRRDGSAMERSSIAVGPPGAQAVAVEAPPAEDEERTDRLIPMLSVIVLATVIAAIAGVMTGVSGLTTGIILVWGVTLAVMVAWAHKD